jgi:hypothetical protein
MHVVLRLSVARIKLEDRLGRCPDLTRATGYFKTSLFLLELDSLLAKLVRGYIMAQPIRPVLPVFLTRFLNSHGP